MSSTLNKQFKNINSHSIATVLAAFLLALGFVYLLQYLCKCWYNTQPILTSEGFYNTDLNQEARLKRLDAGIRVDGYNMDILPDSNSIKVAFRGIPQQEMPDNYRIKGYILVLAQFDHNLVKVGHLNIRLSDETKSSTNDETDNNTLNNNLDISGSICNSENVCQYQFTNLTPRDPETGNLYYYRLGVGIVYVDPEEEEHHSRLVPYGYGDGRRQEYFRIDLDRDAQERLLKRLESIESQNALTGTAAPTTNNTDMAAGTAEDTGIEAYMRMLRPHLGNYPDEFLMSKKQQDDASLSKYMQQSLAVGTLDVNVDIPDVTDNT